MHVRAIRTLVFFVIAIGLAGSAYATTIVFGPKRYEVARDRQVTLQDTIALGSACDTAQALYTLVVEHDDLKKAKISVNGSVVVSEDEVKSGRHTIEKQVVLGAANAVTISMTAEKYDDGWATISVRRTIDLASTLFAEKSYTLTTAKSGTFNESFAAPEPRSDRFTLIVTNTSPQSSVEARVLINGDEVFSKKNIGQVERDVTLLAQNALRLELKTNKLPTTVTLKIVRHATDRVAPTLTLNGIADGQAVTTSVLTLTGTVNDDRNVASLRINGSDVPRGANGAFSKAVQLTAGDNSIVIDAADCEGNQTHRELDVALDVAPPQLVILFPPPNTILQSRIVAVAGTVSDDTDVVSVTVNGTPALLLGPAWGAILTFPQASGDGVKTLTIVATDRAGRQTTKTVGVIIDTTDPTITAVSSPQQNAAGWTRADTRITFQCSDAASGIHSCSEPVLVTTETASKSVSGAAVDNAGNRSTTSTTVRLDKTAPVLTVQTPADGATLTTTQITISGTVGDTLSGVAGVTCGAQSATAANGTFSCAVALVDGTNDIAILATDIAGNVTTKSVRYVVDRDHANPVITITAPAAAFVTKTAAVTVTGTATDDVGVASVKVNGQTATRSGNDWTATITLSAGDGAKSITAIATDAAGKTATASVHGTLDATDPLIAATIAPAPNAAGWNRVDASVSFQCSDATSGVVSCSGPVVVANETAAQIVNGVAVDRAGNQSATAVTVKLDRTAPAISAQSPANQATLSATETTITGPVSDALSGVATVLCGAQVAAIANGTFSCAVTLLDGANDVGITATDVAGNVATTSVHYTVVRDQQAPVVTITAPASGFFTRVPSITVTGTATDDIAIASVVVNGQPATRSGNDWTAAITLPSGDGAKTITVVATDNSGKQTTDSVTGELDATLPQITPSAAPQANAAGWHRSDVSVTFDCTDAGSGIATCGTSATVANETASQLVTGTATDRAGNQATASMTVKLDETAPLLAVVSPMPGSTVNTTAITISGTASDALSGIAGVTCGAQAATVNGATFSCNATLADGDNDVTIVALDVAGNATTTTASYTVIRDLQSPVVTITSPANGGITKTPSITVTGTATDDLGVAAVSVNGQPATLSGSNWTAPIALGGADGTKSVTAVATDTAGKTGNASIAVTLDTTPPSITGSIAPAPNASGWNRTDATVSFSCTDGTSGVATCTQPVTLTAETDSQSVSGTSFDHAGNEATAAVTVRIDKTAPVLAVQAPAPDATLDTIEITITGTVSDARSGVASVTCGTRAAALANGTFTCAVTLVDGSNDLSIVATDDAGNSGRTDVHYDVQRDQQSPVITITSPAGGTFVRTPTFTVTGTATDDRSVATVVVNGQAATLDGSNWTVSLTPGSDGVKTITAIATDIASRQSTATIEITLDTEAPAIVGSPAPAPNEAGWNRSDVLVTFACTDSLSGVATCAGDVTVTADTAEQVVSGNALDHAGNTATATVVIRLDRTRPVLTAISPAGGSTLGSTYVAITGQATDALSGLVSVRCGNVDATLNGSEFHCAVALIDGANDIAITAVDVAGMVATASVHYDVIRTPPTISAVAPNLGLTLGGETVVITGTNFTPDAQVTIGGAAATVTAHSETQLTIVTPAQNAVGPQPVVVTTASGTASAQYSYHEVIALSIEPALVHVSVGGTATAKAIARYSDGQDYDVTHRVVWSSADEAIVSVSGSTLQGRVAGVVVVRATLGTLTAEAEATVVPVVTALSITPPARFSRSGYYAEFIATATYADGTTADVSEAAQWDAPGALKITAGNIALMSGSATVTATYGGQSATATLTVDDGPPVITLDQPATIDSRSLLIPISGSVTDEETLTAVMVGGEAVPIIAGRFATTVQVPEGSSQIFVSAADEGELEDVEVVNVLADATPPEILQLSPPSGRTAGATAMIRGYAYDNVELQRLTINGQPMTLDADASFSDSVSLQRGANLFTVVATDGLGNETTAALTLTYHRTPVVRILEPRDLAFLNTMTARVSGTTDAQSVDVDGVAATVSNGTFVAEGVPLAQGRTAITALATLDGHVSASSINVYRDSIAARVTVESPLDGEVVERAVIPVVGAVEDIVVGTINSEHMRVTVNGRDAAVANRAFLLPDLALTEGTNTIVVVATDQGGNVTTVTRHVVYRPAAAGQAKLVLTGGDAQEAVIGHELAQPISVRLFDEAGDPAAGQPVVFHVLENDGVLVDGATQGRELTLTTDAQGTASVRWRLGSRSGAGNQRVETSATGFIGRPQFIASGLPGAVSRIVVDSGGGQFGLVGQALPRPLIAIVIDEGSNRLAGVPVTFSADAGGGSFDGQPTLTVLTDADGRAIATPTLGTGPGIDNNVFSATVPSGLPAVFLATARIGGPAAETSIAGVILDNTDRPIAGTTIIVEGTTLSTQSDANGQFSLAGVPVGYVKLVIDGSTAQRPGSWPMLEFVMYTLPGVKNTVGMPIYLLPIDLARSVQVDEVTGGTLSFPEMPGFSLVIQPGAATFPGGGRIGRVSVTLVHADKMPMPPGFGQQPRFLVTIQPPGVHFDPPAAMTIPNADGLAPGRITELYSFDHDLGQFVSIGTGSVSDDGLVVRSNPGVGIIKGGWHCGGDPAPDGTTENCPECQQCVNKQCVPNEDLVDMFCPFDPGSLAKGVKSEAGTGGTVDVCSAGGTCGPTPVTISDVGGESSAGGGNGVNAYGDPAFIAKRAFDEVPAEDRLSYRAVATPAAAVAKTVWSVTPASEVRAENPASRKGPTYSFVPEPKKHPAYTKGSSCGSPGKGTCGIDPGMTYSVTAKIGTAIWYDTVSQDLIDMMRQEYANHGLLIPNRDAFHQVQAATHYPSVGKMSQSAYTLSAGLILGEPWDLADAMWEAFNQIVDDDVQAVPYGTTGLSPTTPIVTGGANVLELNRPVLSTALCNGGPPGCDDVRLGPNTIVAGKNGIAETKAKVHTANYTPVIESGWRNPHRNEAIGGAQYSNHQAGAALDLTVPSIPVLTDEEAWCVLVTAAKAPGVAVRAWCENKKGKIGQCVITPTSPFVLHIHMDLNIELNPNP